MSIFKVHVDHPYAARSFSLFGFKVILVGRGFDRLSVDARAAVIAHETYHVEHHHTEWRVLAMLTVLPLFFIRRICHAQEFAADRFAVEAGFRKGLQQLIAADSRESLTHPSHAARRAQLLSPGPRKGPLAWLA